MPHHTNGVAAYKSLVGKSVELAGQDLNITGTLADVWTHGAFGEGVSFLEVHEPAKPAAYIIGETNEEPPKIHLIAPERVSRFTMTPTQKSERWDERVTR